MPETTQAITYDRYGRVDVLGAGDVALPRLGARDVLVRVRAAALNPKDGLFRRGSFRAISGRRFPKQTGCDYAGEVLGVGARVTHVAPGDRVWGTLDEITFARGTLAERLVAHGNECARMPAGLSFEEAAAVPLCALTSLQALRDVAGLRPGDRLLVHGASGGVGVYAIQIARALGAHVETTSSPRNFELCRGLGAEETHDYEGDPALAREGRYRVIFDAMGNKSFALAKRALAPDGVYVTTVVSPGSALDLARTALAKKKARVVVIRARVADLELVARWVGEGAVRPVVDRVFDVPATREAFRTLEARRARGKIVVRIPEDAGPWVLAP